MIGFFPAANLVRDSACNGGRGGSFCIAHALSAH
ncbi:hypothetical protein HMPREF9306_01286 [Propionimicrobium lymphophilum ACS-093-V-SCH5]|uniref:Uncharacterized protein n=1 Tax=Propionimicrobium lymphophilum ACS-093-V-SCH5 TaxID=883161 RepID=S2WIW3_9ACTN|nr:hypothetical protein HMPREF9306_01286 [Propionimicrobium lymphophilum ACS-093-V-SCH5]